MKKAVDNFSTQANLYKKFRPVYPDELYQEILGITPRRDQCWDCGTGNGQVAVELSKHFRQVYASDLSAEQIRHAEARNNISYLVQRAEKTEFKPEQFDLITVAQAIHWFDLEKFDREIKRVAKKDATIAVWGYGLLRIDEKINPLIDHFYTKIVGPFWDPERKHIDEHYQNIQLDIDVVNTDQNLAIQTAWSFEEFIGYLNTWSSVQNYIRQRGENPVEWIYNEVRPKWKEAESLKIVFPVFLKLGKLIKNL